MIAAYNTFAPYAGDFFLVLWLLTIAPLCWLIVRHHDKEAATVFGYTAGLELAAWSVSIWYDPAVLLVVHVILFTLLFSAHFFYCTMEGAYGDHIMTLAALMGFVDLFSLAGKWHAAVHLSIINILFGVICLLCLWHSIKMIIAGGKKGVIRDGELHKEDDHKSCEHDREAVT